MKVSVEEKPDRMVELYVEADPEEIEESMKATYHRLVGRVNIPGFRRGKAPRPILEQYVGRNSILLEAIDYLMPKLCAEALQEHDLEIIDTPEFNIVEREPLKFKATVTLTPLVKLGDYQQIRMMPEEVEVTEEDINRAMESLRDHYATWESVERRAEIGDSVIIDMEGGCEGDPPQLLPNQQAILLEDAHVPIPELTAQIKGMEKEEEREVTLHYPYDYADIPSLAGKTCCFKIKAKEIKEKRLPELDDEFAKTVGEEFDTLQALREQVTNKIRITKQREAMERFDRDLISELVFQCEVQIPPAMVEREINYSLQEEGRKFGEGREGIEKYLTDVGVTENQMRDTVFQPIETNITRGVVLNEVGKKEGIEVNSSEIDEIIEGMAREREKEGAEYEAVKSALNTKEMRWYMHEKLLEDRIMQFLRNIATAPTAPVVQSEEVTGNATSTSESCEEEPELETTQQAE